MEALKTKVLSLTLELKEAKNEIDQLQQEIFDLKENESQESENEAKNKKNLKIPNKTKKTNPLQDKVSNDSQNDEAESEDAISTMSKSELQDECKRLLKKISEMEQFFSDYGLVWIGDVDSNENSESESEENTCNKESCNIKAEGIRMTHTTRSISPNFQKVFSSIDELNIMATEPQIIHTRSGATFKQCELLNLNLYADGIQLENEPFREYSSLSVQEFFHDIEDGYYPTELKGSYPNGVVFKVIDKRHQTYAETQGFSGKGQKLGGRNEACENELDSSREKKKKIYLYETKVEVISHKPDNKKDKSQNGSELEAGGEMAGPSNILKSNRNKKPSDVGNENDGNSDNIPLKNNNNWINNMNVANSSINKQSDDNIFNRSTPLQKFQYPDVKITELNDYKQISNVPQKEKPLEYDIKITEVKTDNENMNIEKPSGSSQSSNNNGDDRKSNKSTSHKKSRRIKKSDENSKRDPEAKRQSRTAPVMAISTETSDRLLVNLPTQTEAGSSGQSCSIGGRCAPINITNINYREAPVNINVTPEALGMIREGVFPRLEEHSQQELPYRCNHGKVFYKGKEYSCGNDCSCGCAGTFVTEPIVRRNPYATEYRDRFVEVSLNEEKDAKPKARRIDPNVRYEHFTFLGHFKDEEAEPNVKEDISKEPVTSLKKSFSTNDKTSSSVTANDIPLNDRTSPSQIEIKIQVKSENYKAYIHPEDPVSKVISMLKSRPEIPTDQDIQPIIIVNDNSKNKNHNAQSISLKKESNLAEHEIDKKSSAVSQTTVGESERSSKGSEKISKGSRKSSGRSKKKSGELEKSSEGSERSSEGSKKSFGGPQKVSTGSEKSSGSMRKNSKGSKNHTGRSEESSAISEKNSIESKKSFEGPQKVTGGSEKSSESLRKSSKGSKNHSGKSEKSSVGSGKSSIESQKSFEGPQKGTRGSGKSSIESQKSFEGPQKGTRGSEESSESLRKSSKGSRNHSVRSEKSSVGSGKSFASDEVEANKPTVDAMSDT
ncbi:uncharacterized protein isoform X3 [Rhodnius prolixus]